MTPQPSRDFKERLNANSKGEGFPAAPGESCARWLEFPLCTLEPQTRAHVGWFYGMIVALVNVPALGVFVPPDATAKPR